MEGLLCLHIRPRPPNPSEKSLPPLHGLHQFLPARPRHHQSPHGFLLRSSNARHTDLGPESNLTKPFPEAAAESASEEDAGSVLCSDVKLLAKFKSCHNYIRVLQVSRRADHPLAGARLLLLDAPGNIHSISFLFRSLTSTYFDVFATLPPLLPPGPLAVLGFGAGSAARLILHLYPDAEVHGWELDPSVVSVAREFFGLAKLEKQHPDRLFVNVGDALEALVEGGFAGILVDLYAKGSVIPALQQPGTWEKMRRKLRRGGRIMVNCGGSCVESEEPGRDGDRVREETLKAMGEVFADQVFVLNMGQGNEDSCVSFTGTCPDLAAWKQKLPSALRCHVDLWRPYSCSNLH